MARHSIELTAEEQALWSSIILKYKNLRGPGLADQNAERVVKLVSLLMKGKAIPEVRIKYWNDPAYQHGRMKGSHQSIFERNGTKGREILEHVHFLPYLRYMVDGADLPAAVIDRFCDAVDAVSPVSGSDALDLAKELRKEVRRYSMNAHEASEEFYKLAFDCGIYEGWANVIRENIKKMK